MVIILRPYSFSSDERKSTHRLLACDSSWKEEVTSTITPSPIYSALCGMAYSAPSTLSSLFLCSSWAASYTVSFGVIFNWAFETVPWGERLLVGDKCRLHANPERGRWSYHLRGERKRSGRTSPSIRVCCNKTDLWINRERIVKLLGKKLGKQTECESSCR